MGVTVDKHGARRQLASMGTVNLTPGDNLPQARRVTGALRMISVDVHAERRGPSASSGLLNRKLPRRPYQLKEKPGESALRDATPPSAAPPTSCRPTLHEIGSVLDQMNHNVLQAATEFDDDESQAR
ncbi:hypothetical protein JL720_15360 [Aureococcus anophagefferens]|nr:hypothetical protein JL720_15360 [Aureococcus anophagefferens]